DFLDGTLAGRERSAYLVSSALGWNIVPYTIIRDGPAGRGMLQLWVDQRADGGPGSRRPAAGRPRAGGLPADPAGLRLRRRRGHPGARRRCATAADGG